MTRVSLLAVVALLAVCPSGFPAAVPLQAGPVTVSGTVSVIGKGGSAADAGDVVVWLKPVDSAGGAVSGAGVSAPRSKPRMIQRNKRFEPGLLVVPVGSTVEFPNLDPFFHNVFSMFDGKRFDLGLYEAGTSRAVTFSTTGVCYVFCNIHPEMSALVVVVDTPYYAVTNRAGEFTVPTVPPGRYALSVWHQRHKPERPGDFPKDLTVSASNPSTGVLRLVDSGQLIAPHKNKYGRDYPPPSANPIYRK